MMELGNVEALSRVQVWPSTQGPGGSSVLILPGQYFGCYQEIKEF